MSGGRFTIVGAGLAGLMAAHAWPAAPVLEAAPQPRAAHRALLRFRTDAVARLTGIEFRRVRVRKGVWSRGRFVEPNIAVANAYATKVIGAPAADRSIWDVAPADRWVAPDTLYEQLVEAAGARIQWGVTADFAGMRGGCVSTAPLPLTLAAMGIAHDVSFDRAPIYVRRWRLRRADVFQTVYFPDLGNPLYRASITGDLVIAEFAGAGLAEESDLFAAMEEIERAFCINLGAAASLGGVEQKYGKIAPVDDAARKRLLFGLTHDHGIYSLGRFATWRNILLDDVVDDIAVIKRLIRSGAPYDLRRAQ